MIKGEKNNRSTSTIGRIYETKTPMPHWVVDTCEFPDPTQGPVLKNVG